MFLVKAVRMSALNPGDVLVLDNASVHVGDAHFHLVMRVLDAAQVRMVTLPTYSPELNPCELAFGYLKARMRSDDILEPHLANLPLKLWIRCVLS